MKNCVLDMQFLLGSFLAFGCHDHQCLEVVAKSDDEEIERFIKTILRRYPPARTLQDMEIWVLTRHFKYYVTTSMTNVRLSNP